MQELMEYICKELEDLQRKVEKEGKLTLTEIQYMDTLAHARKNLLKAEEMEGEQEYSERGSYAYDGGGMSGGSYARRRYSRDGGSYARDGGGYSREGGSYARGRGSNARRDSTGRYSRGGDPDEMVDQLEELMEKAPNEQIKQDFKRLIKQIEQM